MAACRRSRKLQRWRGGGVWHSHPTWSTEQGNGHMLSGPQQQEAGPASRYSSISEHHLVDPWLEASSSPSQQLRGMVESLPLQPQPQSASILFHSGPWHVPDIARGQAETSPGNCRAVTFTAAEFISIGVHLPDTSLELSVNTVSDSFQQEKAPQASTKEVEETAGRVDQCA